MTTRQRITKAVEDYVGRSPAGVQVERDPMVDGVYAVRATFDDDEEPVEFLFNVHDADLLVGDDSEALQECTFNTWPPSSGALHFFC